MAVKPDYKGVIFQGSKFPDDPYQIVPVKLNDTITKEYIPVLDKLPYPKGLKLLMTAMTHAEGFTSKPQANGKPTKAYRTNNPGNIGNTDTGGTKIFKTLEEGINAQAHHLQRIVEGKHKAYPLGKNKSIPPFYSPEIAKNLKAYQVSSGHIPGYKFVYTGQLDQFIKIYATLPRINNNYIDIIVSLFKAGGFEIKPTSKLSEIIALDDVKATPMEELGKIVGQMASSIIPDDPDPGQ